MNPKPGFLTSEFWLAVGTAAAGITTALVAASGSDAVAALPGNAKHWLAVAGMISAGISSAAYAISRAIVKR